MTFVLLQRSIHSRRITSFVSVRSISSSRLFDYYQREGDV